MAMRGHRAGPAIGHWDLAPGANWTLGDGALLDGLPAFPRPLSRLATGACREARGKVTGTVRGRRPRTAIGHWDPASGAKWT